MLHQRHIIALLCITLLISACAADAPFPSPEPRVVVPATSTARSAPAEVIQVPAPSATLVIQPSATATAKAAPATSTPRPPTAVPATETPVPLAVVSAEVPRFGLSEALPGQPVPDVVITNTHTGFSQTLLASTTQVQLVNGELVTSVVSVDVSVAPPPVAPVNLAPGTINIALLGVDTRPREGGLNTDVIIIASVHPTLSVVSLLSIPRDTMVWIPNLRTHKINTAYKYGGETLFKQTIKYNLGLDVHYFAMVDFRAVVNTVNTLEGVEVIATCPLYQVFPRDPHYYADEANPLVVNRVYTDTFTGEVWQPGTLVPTQTIWIPRAGVYTLNGMQALAYARARYGVPGGDIDRGRRTQRLIRAVLSKAKETGSIAKIPELYAQFERNVRTDLTLPQILSIAQQVNDIENLTFRNRFLDGVGLTGVTLPIIGSVLIPNRNNITSYLERTLTVNENVQANEAIPVELWNATANADFAVAVADRLRELGFVVVDTQQVEAAATSSIVDFSTTTKGSAVPILQRNFAIAARNVKSEPQASTVGARYRIIAGDDFNPCYFNTSSSVARTAIQSGTPTPEVPAVVPAVAPAGPEPVPPPQQQPAPAAPDAPPQPPAQPAPTAAP